MTATKTKSRVLLLTEDEDAALYDHLVRYYQHLKGIAAKSEDEEVVKDATEAAKSVRVFTDRLAHGKQLYVDTHPDGRPVVVYEFMWNGGSISTPDREHAYRVHGKVALRGDRPTDVTPRRTPDAVAVASH